MSRRVAAAASSARLEKPSFATFNGVYHFATGDVDGTAAETFVGLDPHDNSTGTIVEQQTLHIDGKSGAFWVRSTIVGSTGDWAGSSGEIEQTGVFPGGGSSGYGAYVGRWVRPQNVQAGNR